MSRQIVERDRSRSKLVEDGTKQRGYMNNDRIYSKYNHIKKNREQTISQCHLYSRSMTVSLDIIYIYKTLHPIHNTKYNITGYIQIPDPSPYKNALNGRANVPYVFVCESINSWIFSWQISVSRRMTILHYLWWHGLIAEHCCSYRISTWEVGTPP